MSFLVTLNLFGSKGNSKTEQDTTSQPMDIEIENTVNEDEPKPTKMMKLEPPVIPEVSSPPPPSKAPALP